MPDKTCRESFKVEGASIIDKIKELVREGNVRRVIIEHQGRTVAEFPLTVGVVGAVFAPILAAIGALIALLKDCTIHVERAVSDPAGDEPAHHSEPAAEQPTA